MGQAAKFTRSSDGETEVRCPTCAALVCVVTAGGRIEMAHKQFHALVTLGVGGIVHLTCPRKWSAAAVQDRGEGRVECGTIILVTAMDVERCGGSER